VIADDFWKRTIEIFRAAPLKITLASGTEVLGEVIFVGADSCTLRRPDGSAARVYYSRIREVVEATPKL